MERYAGFTFVFEPFSGLVFKIMTDPYVGTMAFVRVYSGVLNVGDQLYNATKGKRERVGRLVRMHANNREDIKEVCAGDIAPVVGPKTLTSGDTLCSEDKPVILESIRFPEPVISIAIEAKTKGDQDKVSAGPSQDRARRPFVPSELRHGDGPDAHLGHGRVAPRDRRRSIDA